MTETDREELKEALESLKELRGTEEKNTAMKELLCLAISVLVTEIGEGQEMKVQRWKIKRTGNEIKVYSGAAVRFFECTVTPEELILDDRNRLAEYQEGQHQIRIQFIESVINES